MFSAIKDFIMGTAIQPFIDGASWAHALAWTGAIIGAVAGFPAGGAGILSGLMVGGISGVVAGGAAGMAFGLITGGFREVAHNHQPRMSPPPSRAPQPSIEQQRRAILERQRENGTQGQRSEHTHNLREISDLKTQNQSLRQQLLVEQQELREARHEALTNSDKPIVGHHTAELAQSRDKLAAIEDIGGQR